jgi:hypothetical protein
MILIDFDLSKAEFFRIFFTWNMLMMMKLSMLLNGIIIVLWNGRLGQQVDRWLLVEMDKEVEWIS